VDGVPTASREDASDCGAAPAERDTIKWRVYAVVRRRGSDVDGPGASDHLRDRLHREIEVLRRALGSCNGHRSFSVWILRVSVPPW
jgi:hypothetical protein